MIAVSGQMIYPEDLLEAYRAANDPSEYPTSCQGWQRALEAVADAWNDQAISNVGTVDLPVLPGSEEIHQFLVSGGLIEAGYVSVKRLHGGLLGYGLYLPGRWIEFELPEEVGR